MVIMRDVVDLNKLCISLWLMHKMNFQDIKERWIRRSSLIEEMIEVFKELDIEYRLLPLDVNVRSLPNPNLNSNRLPSPWTTYGSWYKTNLVPTARIRWWLQLVLVDIQMPVRQKLRIHFIHLRINFSCKIELRKKYWTF